MDQNALPASSTRGSFASLQPALPTTPGKLELGARLSFLDHPIEGNQPSPSPSGTQSSVVSGALPLELLLGAGLGAGFDAGLALPLYPYVWGTGLGAAGIGRPIDGFASGDPRATIGWGAELGVLGLRGYGTVYLPLGNADAFAGERTARGDLGLASQVHTGRTTVGLDLGVRLRKESTVGLTTWGPQLLFGLAGAFAWTTALDSTLELHVLPVLSSQPAPLLGEAGYLLPAEALASLGYSLQGIHLRLLGGSGIPLSRPSTDSPDRSVSRGPTSPRLRIGFELRADF